MTASAVTQQLKRFAACQIKGLWEFAVRVTGQFSVAGSRGRFTVGEELIM
jgi:hypothetical protein